MACSAWVTMLNIEESSCTLRLSSSLLRCSGESSLARSAPMEPGAGAWAGARVRCSGLEWTISDTGRGACQGSRVLHHTCHECLCIDALLQVNSLIEARLICKINNLHVQLSVCFFRGMSNKVFGSGTKASSILIACHEKKSVGTLVSYVICATF